MTPRDVYEAFYNVTQIAETGYFKTKGYCFEDFRDGGDEDSAEMMQFDIIDETPHTEYGRRWLEVMMERASVDENYSAYEYGATTEKVTEKPAPADVGGFVFEIPELHKVFANANGSYIQLDTGANSHYDATGLNRIHQKSVSPQLGPSDILLAQPNYNSPDKSPFTTGVGIA